MEQVEQQDSRAEDRRENSAVPLSEQEREARKQEQIRRNQALIALLDELRREDPEDQRETWEILERAIKERGRSA
jgi:hypothetical protein